VIKIEFYDEQGVAHVIWQGNDPTSDLNYLMVKFFKSTFKTDRVKVTLATNVVPGWNEMMPFNSWEPINSSCLELV
jgi:hypothetical protein